MNDDEQEWAAKATEEFEEAGQTPDDEEVDDDAAVVGATAAKQTVYKVDTLAVHTNMCTLMHTC